MEERYLFKAKRIDNGEWEFGSLIALPTGEYEISNKCNNPPDCDPMWDKVVITHKVDPSTICQCTGLKDKNGKLIWENDIIECKDGKRNFQTQIEWDAYCAGFIFQDTETSAAGLDAITANGLYSESKVIGNIFDNTELLESEE